MKSLFFIFTLLLPITLICQTSPVSESQKILSNLKDSARVDSMNALCLKYLGRLWKDSAEYRFLKDSAEIYSGTAYRESLRLHYIYGLALSLSRQGKIAT